MFPAIRIGRTGATALLVLGLLAPAALADVGHVAVDAKGPGSRALIAPGDDLTLRETVQNTGSAPLVGLQGVLSSSTSGVTTDPTALPFTSTTSPGSTTIAVGDSAFDATPFQAHVPSSLDCGTPLRFSVALNGGSEGNVNFTVGTGIPGPVAAFDAPSGALTIPDDGQPVESAIDVPTDGTIKDLRVHIDSLAHQRISDMRLYLIDPDGSRVMLMDKGQAAGGNLQDSVFATSGGGIGASPAPHTGTFRAKGSLSTFVGRNQRGLWKLQLVDAEAGGPASGVLDGWSLETNPPVCDARAEAIFAATPNPVAQGASASFDASASQDPGGTLGHYMWDFGDGSTRDTGTDPHATHTFATRGPKRITLIMQDGAGLTLSQSSRSLLVDRAPVASLTGPPTVASVDAPVTLDASGTTADSSGSIVRYEWDLGTGVFAPADATTGPSKSFDFYTAGVRTSGPHTVRVRVIDDVGASSVATLSIDVTNLLPDAAFTAPTGRVATGRAITLDAGASSDRDGSINSYRWDFDGDGTFDTPALPGPTTTFTPPRAGDFPVTLSVTDNRGGTKTVAHAVHVTDPPTVVVSQPPALVARNAPVTLDTAGSSDPDGTITAWEWDLDGDNTFEVTGPSAPTSETVSFSTFAVHVVRVRVTDNDGVATTVAVPINVANRPPVAALTADKSSADTNSPVRFDASGSSDPDGTIAQYRFDLDDDGSYETVGTSPIATMSYPNAGHVDVHVQVVDSDGGTATAVTGVTVTTPSTGGGGTTGGGTTGGGTTTTNPDTPLNPGAIVPVGGGTAPTRGGGSTTPATPTGAMTAGLDGATVQKLKTVLKSGVALTCKVDRAAKCTVSLTVRAADARRLRISSVRGSKPVVIGTATVTTVTAGTVKVAVKLKAAARKRLATATKVVVMATGQAAAGSASVNLGRSLLLRR